MYPYYNTYSVFFGSTEATAPAVVALKLTDYQIGVEQVLAGLIAIIEEARIEGNATWRSNKVDADLNEPAELRKAKLRSIASTTTDPILAVSEMVSKASRFMTAPPVNSVAPTSLKKFTDFVAVIESQTKKYQDDLAASLKQPENYDELTPEQKAEGDKLQKQLDQVREEAEKAKRAGLPWYKTEVPFYIASILILGFGGYSLWRASR